LNAQWILKYKHPNVYADTSGLVVGGSKYIGQYTDWLAERLSRAIYFASGADKVIFGSDYPVTHPSLAISLVKKLGIDTRDRRRILSENAKKVLRI
jgi:predicted TIM-barrel fold metal-dependent hydrolase